MDIMELGAIGELVGGVAVIGSLLFVGVQIRQNNRLAVNSVAQANRHFNHEIFRGLSSDPEVTKLYFRGLADRAALPTEERLRFDLVIVQLFRGLESQFLEHRDGQLSDEVWESYARAFRPLFHQPGGRASWQRQRDHMTPSFATYVDQLIAVPDEEAA